MAQSAATRGLTMGAARRIPGAAVMVAAILGGAMLVDVAPSAAAPAPTGSAATIAFYRQMVAQTNREGGVTFVVSGYDALRDNIGKTSSVSWISGAGGLPAGYVHAIDHVTLANSAGAIAWVSDEMVPRCAPPAGSTSGGITLGCTDITYQTLLTASGVVGHYLPGGSYGTAGTCWGPDRGSSGGGATVDGYSSSNIGHVGSYGVFGHFFPMRRAGGSELVTSRYPFGAGRRATEVDTISIATHLPKKGVTHVTAGAGHPAFTMTWTNHWLARPPTEPVVRPCG